jgi:outer membrane protein assembly factor BamB
MFGGQDGVVRGLDLKSGKLQWSAFTGGPMKYPPVFAHERLYVGSGDGYVYCLGHGSGDLMWRFRTAPAERFVPIYGSLSSTWPVGSGVLVDGDTAYAASGISNFDGTHVFALDARTGKIKWQQHSSAYQDDDKLPGGGVAVQGPLLLHNDAIHMASGNTPSIASYATKDGKFTPSENGRGKDLFVRDGKVAATGFPLYWRPDDDQFLSTMEFEIGESTAFGGGGIRSILRVGIPPATPTAPNEFAMYPPHKPGDKVKPVWSNNLFQEVAAVAIAKNAIVVTGLNRDKKDHTKIAASVCALDLQTGKVLWQEPLPAVPTAWGLALANRGNDVVVTLMDGRVLAFSK